MNPSDILYAIATSSKRRRWVLTPIGLSIFVVLLGAVIGGALATDRALSMPPLLPGVLGQIAGMILLSLGAILWAWCVVLFWRARGTPVPFNPPQQLVTTGPFGIVRNPILTGVFSCLFGLGFLLHSMSLVLLWAPAFLLFNVLSVKFLEQPELERRFGETYSEYRRRVPMFVPRGFCRKVNRCGKGDEIWSA